MKRYLYIVLVVLSIAAVAWTIQDKPDDRNAVITVADRYILANEFRSAYAQYLVDSGLPDDAPRRSAFADRMVGIELVALEARLNGADVDPTVVREIELVRQSLLVDYYLAKDVYADLQPTEDDLRAMFARVNTSLKARHLFAPDLESALALKSRLDAGASFEVLAAETFSDPALAGNGGSLGFFGFDEMDPAFEDAAFLLSVGEVSDPVRTPHGYSIIKLEDRQVKPILTENEFAVKKGRMRQYVIYRKQLDARRRLSGSIAEQLAPQFADAGIDKLFAVIAGSSPIQQDEQVSELDAIPLVTYSGSKDRAQWTIGQFKAFAELTSPEQRAAVKSKAALTEFIKGLLVRQELLRRASEARHDHAEEYVRALERATTEVFYERGYKVLANRVTVPADSVGNYYDRHRSSFESKPTVLVYEILTDTDRKAREAIVRLQTAPFETVAAELSIRPGAAASGGRLGLVTKEQLGLLGDQLFNAPLNSRIGPLEIDGHFGIFMVRERQAAREASFEEAEADIRTYLGRELTRSFLRSHVDSLRNVHPVTVNIEQILQLELSKIS